MAINTRQNRKKSNFPGATTISGSDTLDYVTQGVNYKITYDNFIAGLGVTGTLVQDGAVTGTPVLDVQGTVNNIRNLENGSGVLASVSPENGITLQHNFQQGTAGGVQVFKDPLSVSPTFRSLVAGDNIGISASNGSIVISSSATGAVTNTVVVTSVGDLPDPVVDVITLEDGIAYRFDALVDISPNRVVFGGNNVMFSNNRLFWGMTTDNTGALITKASPDAFLVTDMRLDSTGGSIFDCSNGAVPLIQDCVTLNSEAASTFDSTGQCLIDNYSLFNFGTNINGLVFTGACLELVINGGLYTNWTGILFDVSGAVFDQGMILGANTRMDSAVGSTIFKAATTSVAAGTTALVHSNKFLGDGLFLDGITKGDIGFIFSLNQGVGDSIVFGAMGLSGNITNTLLSTGAYVQVAGAQIQADTIERCTVNVSDQLEFHNIEEVCGVAVATMDVTRIGGGTDTYLFAIFKNGVQIELTAGSPVLKSIEISATDTQVTIIAPTCFVDLDVFDVRINRQGGTADILIVDMVLEVK
jgi:hypothetical protein